MRAVQMSDNDHCSRTLAQRIGSAMSKKKKLSEALLESELSAKMLWRTYDEMHKESVEWNFQDHVRLISLDFFAKRSREVHLYDVSFRLGQPNPLSNYLMPLADDAQVVSTLSFSEDGSPIVCDIVAADFENHVNKLRSAEKQVSWIHVTDIRVLPLLMKLMDLDHIVESMFYDNRCHSTISVVSGDLFASTCHLFIQGISAILHKVYHYGKGNVIITYERELLAEIATAIESSELEELIKQEREVLAAKDLPETEDEEYLRAKINRLLTSLGEPIKPTGFKGICQRVMMKLSKPHNLDPRYKRSTANIFYELATEGQVMSESCLHVISRSMAYLRSHAQQKKLIYRVSRNLHRNVNTLRTIVSFARRLNDEIVEGLAQVLSTASTEFESYRQINLTTAGDRLYISQLQDTFNYWEVILLEQANDVAFVAAAMQDSTNNISERNARNLNLVATVFLPLSFLAGVFGMNFYPDGDSSIRLLNDPNGPLYFALLCFAVVIINVLFFARSGMLNLLEDTSGFSIIRDHSDEDHTSRQTMINIRRSVIINDLKAAENISSSSTQNPMVTRYSSVWGPQGSNLRSKLL